MAQINVTTPVLDFDGKTPVPRMILRHPMVQALTANDDPSLTGEQRVRLAEMGIEIATHDVVDLTPEQWDVVKAQVGKTIALNVAVLRVWQAIDAACGVKTKTEAIEAGDDSRRAPAKRARKAPAKRTAKRAR